MRRIIGWIRHAASPRTPPHPERSAAMASADIVAIQRSHPGLWVAVKNDEVVDARESPYALTRSLHDRDIEGATIFRCPLPDEAELVGLG